MPNNILDFNLETMMKCLKYNAAILFQGDDIYL